MTNPMVYIHYYPLRAAGQSGDAAARVLHPSVHPSFFARIDNGMNANRSQSMTPYRH